MQVPVNVSCPAKEKAGCWCHVKTCWPKLKWATLSQPGKSDRGSDGKTYWPEQTSTASKMCLSSIPSLSTVTTSHWPEAEKSRLCVTALTLVWNIISVQVLHRPKVETKRSKCEWNWPEIECVCAGQSVLHRACNTAVALNCAGSLETRQALENHWSTWSPWRCWSPGSGIYWPGPALLTPANRKSIKILTVIFTQRSIQK